MHHSLRERYFNWMYKKVVPVDVSGSYRMLLKRLDETDFFYILQMDKNREEDGLDLRYRFGHEEGISTIDIINHLDTTDCSVLEMMVALAIRCEEDIMDDPEIGDRTSRWFFEMIYNLGLSDMTDENYDEDYVDSRIYIFLHRQYDPDGNGGLFHLTNCPDDLREVQIWYQMNWYLNEILEN